MPPDDVRAPFAAGSASPATTELHVVGHATTLSVVTDAIRDSDVQEVRIADAVMRHRADLGKIRGLRSDKEVQPADKIIHFMVCDLSHDSLEKSPPTTMSMARTCGLPQSA